MGIHPKYVDQFTELKNRVTFHLVGHTLECRNEFDFIFLVSRRAGSTYTPSKIFSFFLWPENVYQNVLPTNFISTDVNRFMICLGKVKVKAIPLQARTSPEGSRSLRFPDFKTFGT